MRRNYRKDVEVFAVCKNLRQEYYINRPENFTKWLGAQLAPDFFKRIYLKCSLSLQVPDGLPRGVSRKQPFFFPHKHVR